MRARSIVGIVLAIVIVAALVQWLRPIPTLALRAVGTTAVFPGKPPHLPWPAGDQAAVDVPGVGWMGTNGPSAPEAIGSVAKVMTALVVLKHHPLGPYSNGPSVTITPADVTAYQAALATQQSVMPVTAGEKLSERTLLEGLLVPSANNVASILARWMSGSTAAFAALMNQEAKSLGLRQTRYADVSGLSPNTVSTASDQVRLAEVAMQNATFKAMVAMPQMYVPGFGLMYNYNHLIGQDGIIGVKTGSLVPQGASFIWAGERTVGGATLTLYGGLLGQQPTAQKPQQLQSALTAGQALLNASGAAVHAATVVTAHQTVGQLSAPWAAPVPLVTAGAVSALGWGGLPIRMSLKATLAKADKGPVAAGTRVGTLTVRVGEQVRTVAVLTGAALPAPSPSWRIRRL